MTFAKALISVFQKCLNVFYHKFRSVEDNYAENEYAEMVFNLLKATQLWDCKYIKATPEVVHYK